MEGEQGRSQQHTWLQAQLLEPAFRYAFNALVITDADFANGGPHIVAANPAFCAMTGYTEAELIGQSPRILQGPASDRAVIDRLSKAIRSGEYFFGRTVNYRKDGTPYDVEWNISTVYDGESIVGYISIQQDLTSRIAAEREHALFATVSDLLPVPLMITDAQHRITFANQAFLTVTGYSRDELVGNLPHMLYAPTTGEGRFWEDVRSLAADTHVERRLELRRKDGTALHTAQRVIALSFDDGRDRMHVGTFTDVSEYAASEARWRSLANRDALTGVLNRRGGDAALAALVRSAERNAGALTVMLADIDHFKRVNDTHGHATGDRILTLVAQTMERTLRDADVVARFGGEEFLVAAPGLSASAAAALAERLRANVAACSDPEVGHSTISLGVAVWRDGESAAEVLDRADAALYQAKAQGRNCVVVADAV